MAISNHRLIGMRDGKVSFSFKDRSEMGVRKVMAIDAEEFIRRFLLHVLPGGFMRIRHYGFLANRSKKQDLQRIREILRRTGREAHAREESTPALMLRLTGIDVTQCPSYRTGTMHLIAEISNETAGSLPPAPGRPARVNSS